MEKDRKYWFLVTSIILLSVGLVAAGWYGVSLALDLRKMKQEQREQNTQPEKQSCDPWGETSR